MADCASESALVAARQMIMPLLVRMEISPQGDWFFSVLALSLVYALSLYMLENGLISKL